MEEDKNLDEVLDEFTESFIEEEPIKKPAKRSKKVIYKLTNKTFQPLQIVLSERESILLGPRKKDNIAYVKELTSQINNLQKRGLIKIRKMS